MSTTAMNQDRHLDKNARSGSDRSVLSKMLQRFLQYIGGDPEWYQVERDESLDWYQYNVGRGESTTPPTAAQDQSLDEIVKRVVFGKERPDSDLIIQALFESHWPHPMPREDMRWGILRCRADADVVVAELRRCGFKVAPPHLDSGEWSVLWVIRPSDRVRVLCAYEHNSVDLPGSRAGARTAGSENDHAVPIADVALLSAIATQDIPIATRVDVRDLA